MEFQRRDVDFKCLSNVATWISNVATWSLRVFVTSRCRFIYPLERRNVSNQRRDVDFNEPLKRRDVDTQHRDVVNPTLCNVATLPRTS